MTSEASAATAHGAGTPVRVRPRRRHRRRRGHVRQAVGFAIAFVAFLPLLWLIVSSFRPAADIFVFAFPRRLTLDNFITVIRDDSFIPYMLNSAFIAGTATIFSLWFHSMAGFALARMRFPGRETTFVVIISTLLVSFSVILVPLFLIVKAMGLLDSYAGVILPSIFGAFGIFWLRQFYLGIPKELEDACLVDGCGWLRVWWHVAVPLSRPVLAALAVLFFVATWNAYLWPLAILSSQSKWTVQLGLANLQGQFSGAWNAIMAGSLLIALPTVILFVIFQRQIVNSLKSSGLR